MAKVAHLYKSNSEIYFQQEQKKIPFIKWTRTETFRNFVVTHLLSEFKTQVEYVTAQIII